MKNSKEYSKKITELHRSLKKGQNSVKKPIFDDPIDTVVFAVINENLPEALARAIIKKIEKHFINLNDLRVSRTEEVTEILRGDSKAYHKLGERLTEVLNSIFNKYNTMSLSPLEELGKRQARKELDGLGGMSDFVASYCSTVSFGSHTIPLTDGMIEYLKESELVNPNADAKTIEGFLVRKIKAADGFTFYTLLRHESEKPRKKIKKAKKAKKAKKTVKKTAKKAAAPKTKKKAVKKTAKKTTKKKVAKKAVKKTTKKKATKKRAPKKTVTKKKKK